MYLYQKRAVALWVTGAFTGMILPVTAQNIPVAQPFVPATAIALPPAITGKPVNYIRTWVPTKPITLITNVTGTTNPREVNLSTVYYDGLSRPIQTVNRATTPLLHDVVQPVTYDQTGKERWKYLPYATGTADGNFRGNAFTEQSAFMKSMFNNETIGYEETILEGSPLARIISRRGAGSSWGGSSKGINTSYGLNDAADEVIQWEMDAASGLPVKKAVFPAGQLFRNNIVDEDGHTTITFNDKEGRLLLKKVKIAATAGAGHANWLCTYQVYNEKGLLCFVIPPAAVEDIRSNWILTADVATGRCFQYTYDAFKRMISKKVPGAAVTEMVYDNRDRLVFTRDGAMKAAGNWMVTFYDDINRPTMTGFYQSVADRNTLQTSINTASGNGQISYNFPVSPDLVLTKFDNKPLYEAGSSITIMPGFETSANAESILQINSAAITGTAETITNNPLPNLDNSKLYPLTYNYYDNYTYAGANSFVAADLSLLVADATLFPETVSTYTVNTTGKLTGTAVRVLNSNQWLVTSTYFDANDRIIQQVSNNAPGGKTIISNLYGYTGSVLSTITHLFNPLSTASPEITLLTQNMYDHAGRLTGITKKINNDNPKTVATFSYNELGHLSSKVLGDDMETLTYDYNIRGWLSGINKDYANGTGTHFFGMTLNYDKGYTQPLLNGNVSGMSWRSSSDGLRRSYGYGYDGAERLLKADFTQFNSAWNTTAGVDYSMTVGNGTDGTSAYDFNGNILTMTQKGYKAGSSSVIDQLQYSYTANTNQLKGVKDLANNPASQLGDFKESQGTGVDDYDYDVNGNLTRDHNKAIPADGIHYNFLNMPDRITLTGKGEVAYVYDASGIKLRKTVKDITVTPAKTTVTDYVNGMVFQNDALQYAGHEEGRIRPIFTNNAITGYAYDYYIKDHLGNVRVTLTDETVTNLYAATMETEKAPVETALFSNVESTRTVKPVGYPAAGTTAKNEFVANTNGKQGGNKIGPSLVLRVMAGDTIQISTQAFYKSQGPTEEKPFSPEADIINGLLQAFGRTGTTAAHGTVQAEDARFNSNFYTQNYRRLKQRDNAEQPGRPRAYLNYVLFDDQMKMVDENSGVKQVQATPDQLQELKQGIPVQKTGFMYVYTSNETPQDVTFDNLLVAHTAGRIIDESHYYPFGLVMEGISSKALGPQAVRARFTGLELDEEHDLNLYQFQYRSYNPQTGRFIQVDPLASTYTANSTYAYAENRPVNGADLEGKEWKSKHKWSDVIKDAAHIQNLKDAGEYSKNMTYAQAWGKRVDDVLRAREGQPFDCADLSITALVDFAAYYKLPVYFEDYKGGKDRDPTFSNDNYGFVDKQGKKHTYQEGEYQKFAKDMTKDDYYGAPDLYNNENLTVIIKDFNKIKAGDLVGLQYNNGHFHSQTVSGTGEEGFFTTTKVYFTIQGNLHQDKPMNAYFQSYGIEKVGTGKLDKDIIGTQLMRWNFNFFDSKF